MYYVRDNETYNMYLIVQDTYMVYGPTNANGKQVDNRILLLPCMQHLARASYISILYNNSGLSEVAVWNMADQCLQKMKMQQVQVRGLLQQVQTHPACIDILQRQVNQHILQLIALWDDKIETIENFRWGSV